MKKLLQWIGSLFNKTKQLVQKFVVPSITTLENLKAIIDSPVIDILTAIIPGNIDDTIKVKIRQYLPAIILDLQLAEKILTSTDPNTYLQAAIELLQKMHPDERNATYKKIAVQLAECLSDGKLTLPELAHLVETTYTELFKKQ